MLKNKVKFQFNLFVPVQIQRTRLMIPLSREHVYNQMFPGPAQTRHIHYLAPDWLPIQVNCAGEVVTPMNYTNIIYQRNTINELPLCENVILPSREGRREKRNLAIYATIDYLILENKGRNARKIISEKNSR